MCNLWRILKRGQNPRADPQKRRPELELVRAVRRVGRRVRSEQEEGGECDENAAKIKGFRRASL